MGPYDPRSGMPPPRWPPAAAAPGFGDALTAYYQVCRGYVNIKQKSKGKGLLQWLACS